MADPISMTASIISLATFAVQSSKALYDAVETIRDSGRSIRELKIETGALSGVLSALADTLAVSDAGLRALRVPLQQCGQICENYAVILTRFSAHTSDGKFSWRDCLVATYRGKNLADLRSLIRAYKSTITIALVDAKM